MESPTELAHKFMDEAKKLFEFLKQINDYLGKTRGGGAPAPPAALSFLIVLIDGGGVEMAAKVCDTFAARAVPNFETIRSRKTSVFIDIAPDLFPEVPRGILQQVVEILRNDDAEFVETIDDIFAYIDSLLDLAVRRQIVLGESAAVPRSTLVEITRKIQSMPQAYRGALGL